MELLPRNSDLFSNLSLQEEEFIRPDEYPWMVPTRMKQFMNGCAHEDHWPDSFPPFSPGSEATDKMSIADVDGIRGRNIRGGKLLIADVSVIGGPIVLGQNVRIRRGVVITGPAYIGDNVVIGLACRIKHSVILPGTVIQHGTRVSHAFLGRNVFVGQGTRPMDELREKQLICYRQKDPNGSTVAVHNTEFRELGLMCGDGAWIGAGAIFGPGVILDKGTIVEPGTRVLDPRLYRGWVAEVVMLR